MVTRMARPFLLTWRAVKLAEENEEIGIASPEWAELLRLAIEERLFHLHTGLPAKVVEYDPACQCATVQPMLKRAIRNEDGEVEVLTIPPITRAPVIFPSGNGYRIAWKLAKDDVVFLTFAERSLDKVLDAEKGRVLDPLDSRKHDLSDAVVIPGFRQRGSAQPDPGDDLVIGAEDGSTQITITKNGDVTIKAEGTIKIGDGASESAVLGDALATWLTSTLQVASPLGPIGPAVAPPVAGSELSNKVKVKP